MALSEQRLNQLNSRARDIEDRLRGKETELAQAKQQFQQLTADFRYNLKLLEDRDAELERLDAAVVTHRAAAEKAEQALAQAKSTLAEREGELRRQTARALAELEAYYGEKVERLRKQTDEARYAATTSCSANATTSPTSSVNARASARGAEVQPRVAASGNAGRGGTPRR